MPKRKAAQMHVTILGQIDGPIGGQSRLTRAYHDSRPGRTAVLEFLGHKAWNGPFVLASQLIRAFWLVMTGQTNAAYVAMSRSNFGMIRDLFLLMPFILARRPIIAHVHGAEFDAFYLDNPRFARLKALYLARVTRFIFVNEVFVPRRPDLAGRSTFIRNPIPGFAVRGLDKISPVTRGPRPCLGFISTFARGKVIEDFLHIAELFEGRADFAVAGGPSHEDRAYGEQIMARIASMPQIAYMGYLSDPTPFYARCDAMIFPTSFASETSSLVIIEALALCTHPIVRRHNRLTDIFGAAPISWFDDRNGLAAQVENVLVRSAEAMLADQARGQAWIKGYFPTEAEWADQVELVVSEAVADRERQRAPTEN
jgi:glycosyltransferase involved in cell wall biosynthesis